MLTYTGYFSTHEFEAMQNDISLLPNAVYLYCHTFEVYSPLLPMRKFDTSGKNGAKQTISRQERA